MKYCGWKWKKPYIVWSIILFEVYWQFNDYHFTLIREYVFKINKQLVTQWWLFCLAQETFTAHFVVWVIFLSPRPSLTLILIGPVHICSRYTTPAKCSRNMFSVHERSYYEHCEMFSVPIRSGWKWHASRSAQYDVLCIHCATCEVILMCTLRADSGLRAKPRPLRTLFSVHERSYLFWMCTKGAICSENMVWPCSSWNCSSGNNSL